MNLKKWLLWWWHMPERRRLLDSMSRSTDGAQICRLHDRYRSLL